MGTAIPLSKSHRCRAPVPGRLLRQALGRFLRAVRLGNGFHFGLAVRQHRLCQPALRQRCLESGVGQPLAVELPRLAQPRAGCLGAQHPAELLTSSASMRAASWILNGECVRFSNKRFALNPRRGYNVCGYRPGLSVPLHCIRFLCGGNAQIITSQPLGVQTLAIQVLELRCDSV